MKESKADKPGGTLATIPHNSDFKTQKTYFIISCFSFHFSIYSKPTPRLAHTPIQRIPEPLSSGVKP
jgi:hypothetical protein